MKICCGNPLSQSGQFRSAARIIRISAFSRRPSARMIRLSFKKGDGEISLLLLDMLYVVFFEGLLRPGEMTLLALVELRSSLFFISGTDRGPTNLSDAKTLQLCINRTIYATTAVNGSTKNTWLVRRVWFPFPAQKF